MSQSAQGARLAQTGERKSRHLFHLVGENAEVRSALTEHDQARDQRLLTAIALTQRAEIEHGEQVPSQVGHAEQGGVSPWNARQPPTHADLDQEARLERIASVRASKGHDL